MIEFELIDNSQELEANLIDNSQNIEVELIKEIDKYDDLKGLPSINDVTLTGNKTLQELGIQPEGDYSTNTYVNTELNKKVDKIVGKGLSTNDYTTEEKNKLASLYNYDDSEIVSDIVDLQNNKVDKTEGKGLSTNDFTDVYKSNINNNTSARHTHSNKTVIDGISSTDISNWNNKADESDIPDVSDFITKDVNNLTNYTLKTNTGSLIDLEINDSTYVVTLKLKNSDGTVISTDTIDLPLESVVVSGRYDNTTKKVILTLQNGNTVEFSIADLIDGLVNQSTFNALVTRVSNAESEISNARASGVKSKSFASVDARIEELEVDVDNIKTTTGHVYGIRRKISSNTSPSWERLDDAVGLTANATKNGGVVQNDFDNLSPWKDIISFNLDLETGKKKAYYGEPGFKFDGSNGDVYTHIPTFWLKLWQANDYMYVSIADYNKVGYTEIQGFDIARYLLGIGEDTKPHSYSGLAGADFRSIVTYRNLVKNSLGNDYCLMDWRYFVIQCLYLVEYATFNSQTALGNGMQLMRHNNSDKALIEETNTSRIIVNTTAGNTFVVGQQVKIGRYESLSAVLRTITEINAYDDGTITGKEIVLDEEIASITLNTTIWSCVQSAGQCDSLGMKSGCINNDSKHNVIYRGIENFFGNIFQFVDGINIKNNVAWVCYDSAEYVSDKFEAPYEELGYTNANTNGYGKILGFDVNHPLIQFPIEIGASTSTGTCDYYYQDAGNRVARVGGGLNNGTFDGALYWILSGNSSSANWNCGARVIKYQ